MKLAACLLALAAAGCPDIKTDPGEGSGLPTVDGPTVEFDPLHSILPFPNNLVLCATGVDSTGAPCTIGKVAIPPAACESAASKAIRTGVLNQLDGFGTFEAAMQVTFTEAVDAATLDGHIVMYQRTKGATPNDPTTAQPIPIALIKGTTLRFSADACTSPAVVDAVTIVPKIVLDQKSTYTVAVLAGVKTANGADYLPSSTWGLIRQAADPVTVDTSGNITAESTPLVPGEDANGNGVPDTTELLGLDHLWKAHAQAMTFLAGVGDESKNVLLAWETTTQTTTDPLDASVAGSPASAVATNGFVGLQSIACDFDATTCPNGIHRNLPPYSLCVNGETNTVCFLEIALGAASGAADVYGAGRTTCQLVGCAGVGDILGGVLFSQSYQVGLPNPLANGAPIPGAWTDPVAPAAQLLMPLQAVVFIPAGAPPSAAGFPTLVFGHGLTSSKSALFAFGPQLAANLHMASIAIDFVDHGSRAVRISNTGACAGTTLNPSALPQCFAPIFSSDLAQTRDNIRQTVLDLQRVVHVAKFCGANACTSLTPSGSGGAPSTFAVDPAHIVYGGQSLGGIIGTTATATSPDINSALLNVPAVGLLDVLENTQTLEIRCQLVDSLIDAGVLVGGKSDSATPLCVDTAWEAQLGYRQFSAIARWVLDPADGANFASRLLTKKILIQEVVDDQVVPNVATNIEGALLGLTPGTADPATSATPMASTVVTTMPTASKWVRYPTLPPIAAQGFPGNTFAHASLLRPATSGLDGQLGTIRLQTDALTFLGINH